VEREWAVDRVQAFVNDADEYGRLWRRATGGGGRTNLDLENRLVGQLDTIVKIAERAQPEVIVGLRTRESSGYRFPWTTSERSARILLGSLQDAEEVERHLGPQGPQLAASSMHPLVSGAAASLWDDGYRREAIQAAATAIFDQYLPARLGVPRGTKHQDLASAFSTNDPLPGHPRLRLPGYVTGDENWKNAHDGAQAIGRGCAMALRNLSSHTTDQPEEQAALEALATLSLFCRWAHDAVVERAEESSPEQAGR
jgi:hypothetical protein